MRAGMITIKIVRYAPTELDGASWHILTGAIKFHLDIERVVIMLIHLKIIQLVFNCETTYIMNLIRQNILLRCGEKEKSKQTKIALVLASKAFSYIYAFPIDFI